MDVLILAGGDGTRIKTLTRNKQKALLKINNVSLLLHQVKQLSKISKTIYVSIKESDNQIIKEFKKIKRVKFVFIKEKKKLGTAGSLKELESFNIEDLLVIYSDILFNINLKKFIKFHFKKKNTVIAPTASYESLVDAIKLKNKFHKIIRYLIKKYKFKKNFDEFPNPHIRTSSFLINSKLFLNFIKFKQLRNKEDTWKIESGKNSLTKYLKKKGVITYVVNSDGNKFEEKNWKLSETYCYLNENKSIISDKHSRKFLKLSNYEKNIIRSRVWGTKL